MTDLLCRSSFHVSISSLRGWSAGCVAPPAITYQSPKKPTHALPLSSKISTYVYLVRNYGVDMSVEIDILVSLNWVLLKARA